MEIRNDLKLRVRPKAVNKGERTRQPSSVPDLLWTFVWLTSSKQWHANHPGHLDDQ